MCKTHWLFTFFPSKQNKCILNNAKTEQMIAFSFRLLDFVSTFDTISARTTNDVETFRWAQKNWHVRVGATRIGMNFSFYFDKLFVNMHTKLVLFNAFVFFFEQLMLFSCSCLCLYLPCGKLIKWNCRIKLRNALNGCAVAVDGSIVSK